MKFKEISLYSPFIISLALHSIVLIALSLYQPKISNDRYTTVNIMLNNPAPIADVKAKTSAKSTPKPIVKKETPKPVVKKVIPKPVAKKETPKPVIKKEVPKPATKPTPAPAVKSTPTPPTPAPSTPTPQVQKKVETTKDLTDELDNLLMNKPKTTPTTKQADFLDNGNWTGGAPRKTLAFPNIVANIPQQYRSRGYGFSVTAKITFNPQGWVSSLELIQTSGDPRIDSVFRSELRKIRVEPSNNQTFTTITKTFTISVK